MSYVVKKVRCPKCEANGQDRSGDNLAVYSDDHSHCFACGYHTAGSLSSQIDNASTGEVLTLPSFCETGTIPRLGTAVLPQACKDWLSKYGITDTEVRQHRVYYNQEDQRLCFPVYYGHILSVSQGRYFGSDPKQPKYFTYGPRNKYYKIISGTSSSVFVLVEDFISAIKVGRLYSAIPLLGSSYSRALVLALLGKASAVRLWLDFDKAKEAIKLASETRQWIPDCGTIITEKDPKDYTTKEIESIVKSSLSGSNQSLSKL